MKYKEIELTPVELLQNMLDGKEMYNLSDHAIVFSDNGIPSIKIATTHYSMTLNENMKVKIPVKWWENLEFPALVKYNSCTYHIVNEVIGEHFHFDGGFVYVDACELVTNEELKALMQPDDKSADRWIVKCGDRYGGLREGRESPLNIDKAKRFHSKADAEFYIDTRCNNYWKENAIIVKLDNDHS